MHAFRRLFSLLTVAAAALLVLAACGQADDSDSPLVTRVPVEGAPPTITPAPATGDDPLATGDTNAEGQTGNAAQGGQAPAGGEPAPAGGDQAAAGGAPAVELGMPGIAWSTNEFTIPVGGTIHFVNDGSGGNHNFVVEGYNNDEPLVDLPAGYDDNFTLPADLAPGTYTFVCTIPGHQALMTGTMTVE